MCNAMTGRNGENSWLTAVQLADDDDDDDDGGSCWRENIVKNICNICM